MGTLYAQSTGTNTNSGSSDNASADVTLTVHATYVSGTTVQITVNTGSIAALPTSGATQAAVYFPDANNGSSRKLFWITAVDDVSSPKTITVDTAPTGLTAGTSVGSIGGRIVLPALNHEAAVRPGDVVMVNDNMSNAAILFTFRQSGDDTSGPAIIRGKAGTRPTLTVTGGSQQVVAFAGGITGCTVEHLELVNSNATNGSVTVLNSSCAVIDCKISDSPTTGISLGASQNAAYIAFCEITGCAGDAIIGANNRSISVIGCYIHGNGGDGIQMDSAAGHYIDNLIVDNSGRGIYLNYSLTGPPGFSIFISGNTIANNGNSGLEATDSSNPVVLVNNIFFDNGNAAGEYNVESAAGTFETYGWHGYNLFYHSVGTPGGPENFSNLVAKSTESTSDPLFTNEAAGDYTLQSSSPAKATAISATTAYRDMGALQRQEAGGGGGVVAHVIGG
jgi:hypothetical protein